MAVPRLLMLPGLMEHRSLEVVVMVATVVAEVEAVDTVMETVDVIEDTAGEEVVVEAVVITVVNQATSLVIVTRMKAVVVDTQEVVDEEAVAVATNVARTATLPVNAPVVVSDRGLLCFQCVLWSPFLVVLVLFEAFSIVDDAMNTLCTSKNIHVFEAISIF